MANDDLPKGNMQDTWGMLSDILRGVSLIVRCCIVLGLVAGPLVFLLWASDSEAVPTGGTIARLLTWGLVLALIAGGFAGCLVGVLIEGVIALFRGKKPPKKAERKEPYPPRYRL